MLFAPLTIIGHEILAQIIFQIVSWRLFRAVLTLLTGRVALRVARTRGRELIVGLFICFLLSLLQEFLCFVLPFLILLLGFDDLLTYLKESRIFGT